MDMAAVIDMMYSGSRNTRDYLLPLSTRIFEFESELFMAKIAATVTSHCLICVE